MSNIYKQIAKIGESIAEDVKQQVYGIARAKVQNDFNNEVVDYVASYTNHPTLSQTVFVDISLDSIDLKVDKYTDSSFVAGIFKSNSSFHPGFEGWRRVSKLRGMSHSEFWELKRNGELDGGDYGGVDSDWLTDNFWGGIVVGTNGWPKGSAEFLSVTRSREASGKQALDAYVRDYIASERYQKYILEALNKFI